MDQIGELFQKYVNLDQEDLISLALNSMSEFMPVLKEVDREYNGALCLAMMIAGAFGADGEFTVNERAFLGALNIDIDLVKELLKEREIYDTIDTLVDSMNSDQKAAALSFMICLCAIDERIAPEENAFLRQLID